MKGLSNNRKAQCRLWQSETQNTSSGCVVSTQSKTERCAASHLQFRWSLNGLAQARQLLIGVLLPLPQRCRSRHCALHPRNALCAHGATWAPVLQEISDRLMEEGASQATPSKTGLEIRPLFSGATCLLAQMRFLGLLTSLFLHVNERALNPAQDCLQPVHFLNCQ